MGLSCLLLCVQVSEAKSRKRKAFVAAKKEIVVLTVERIRTAHYDFQRAVVMGENRIQQLHADYQVDGSTPPTKLSRDLSTLRSACQKMRLQRARGRKMPPDPKAAPLIEKYWDEYAAGYDNLLNTIQMQKQMKAPENRIYWDAMSAFVRLRSMAEEKLVFNTPPGYRRLQEALNKNEWTLLKAIEITPKKTRGHIECVVAPEENIRTVTVDVAPFYHHPQGLLPETSPEKIGAFTVPPGCRTVTKRESGIKLIFRLSHGKGVAYMGSSEIDLIYGYFVVPPDTAYYFENTTPEPLNLEYIGLR